MNLGNRINELADQFNNELISIRRNLHANPELSFKEYNTSELIQRVLESWNISFTKGWAETGIVGVIESNNISNRVIALRADIDALPIQEQNNLTFISKNDGVMHACGHDVHTTCLLGAIKILNELKNEWNGKIKFIFQPGEEKLPGGASILIQQNVLSNPTPLCIIGQHVQPNMKVGQVGVCSGKSMASCDEIYLSIIGKGGHAAMPHLTINPLLVVSKLLLKMEAAMDFEKSNGANAILSFGKLNSVGGATNIIPEEVNLEGTLRCMDEDFRSNFHLILQKICQNIAKETNSVIDLRIDKGYPCLINNIHLVEEFTRIAKNLLGNSNVLELSPRMTSEDFAYYSQLIPSIFYRLGTGESTNVHTPQFVVNEDSVKIGASLMASLAIKINAIV